MSAFDKLKTRYREVEERKKLDVVREGLNLFKRMYGSDERFRQYFQEAESHLNEKDHSGALTYLAIIDVVANQEKPIR